MISDSSRSSSRRPERRFLQFGTYLFVRPFPDFGRCVGGSCFIPGVRVDDFLAASRTHGEGECPETDRVHGSIPGTKRFLVKFSGCLSCRGGAWHGPLVGRVLRPASRPRSSLTRRGGPARREVAPGKRRRQVRHGKHSKPCHTAQTRPDPAGHAWPGPSIPPTSLCVAGSAWLCLLTLLPRRPSCMLPFHPEYPPGRFPLKNVENVAVMGRRR